MAPPKGDGCVRLGAGILLVLGDESFSTTVSDCTLENDELFTHFVSQFVSNIGWLIGEFEGGVVVPAEGAIPPFPVESPLFAGVAGEVMMTIERIEPN